MEHRHVMFTPSKGLHNHKQTQSTLDRAPQGASTRPDDEVGVRRGKAWPVETTELRPWRGRGEGEKPDGWCRPPLPIGSTHLPPQARLSCVRGGL
mmetsp:Transcript_25499/g.37280  ORF Transcript_25499/g.37280 Transcript_25499/m.37280 type:complete len:95 (+) Transcript_25499:314-598(+)